MKNCSKGARGLSVQPQIVRIFTDISISLRSSLRQWGNRYTIHAGQQLINKEFRYLRTVRVTAAVYQGFDLKHIPFLLTFWHRAGVRPYTSSYDLAEPCVFIKQSLPPILCHSYEYLLSQSYKVILPSSLNLILSRA